MKYSEVKKTYNNYYTLHDGYGIVGIGFKCFKCKNENNFLSLDREVVCKHCKTINRFNKTTIKESEEY
jgi:hypothetical protein